MSTAWLHGMLTSMAVCNLHGQPLAYCQQPAPTAPLKHVGIVLHNQHPKLQGPSCVMLCFDTCSGQPNMNTTHSINDSYL
jgi:hypothetical protein